MRYLKLTDRPENSIRIVESGRSREGKVVQWWLSVDPLAEKYPSWSPYSYTLQNPINFTDPTGMVVEGSEWIPQLNNDGSTSYIAESGDSAVDFPFLGQC